MNDQTKKRFLWITAVFVFLGSFFFLYWVVWGRFSVSTDDAYVNGNMILVTPQQSGIITSIWADNTQLVEEGQPLLELDKHDYEIALDRAKADLANAVRTTAQLFLKVEELKAKRERAFADLFQARLDFDHRNALVVDGGVSREDFEHSETAFAAANALVKQIEKELEAQEAEVRGTTIPSHPKVEQAKATLRKAYLDLHRCTVIAPARGLISQRKAQIGRWVMKEDQLMALIPLEEIWVDANFREVSLKNLRIGQPVELRADMYGSDITFHGKVQGLNGGTGSVFSILPPQNASGNWIKIVQRVPVKISLDPKEILAFPLILGLSMNVRVDTHDRTGIRLPESVREKAIYQTHVYKNELSGVNQLIEQIISENSP